MAWVSQETVRWPGVSICVSGVLRCVALHGAGPVSSVLDTWHLTAPYRHQSQELSPGRQAGVEPLGLVVDEAHANAGAGLIMRGGLIASGTDGVAFERRSVGEVCKASGRHRAARRGAGPDGPQRTALP